MEYKSLFEYLNRAAGLELGKNVNQAANIAVVWFRTQHVTSSKYIGEVIDDPTGFLDSYFLNTTKDYGLLI